MPKHADNAVTQLAQAIAGTAAPRPKLNLTGSSVDTGTDLDTRVRLLPVPIGTEDQVLTVVLNGDGDLEASWEDSAGGGGSALVVQEGDSTIVAAATTIDFDASDFNVSESPTGEANIALAYGTGAGTPAEGNHSHALTSASISDFTEAAQDAVGAMIADTSSTAIVYTDATPSLVVNVKDEYVEDTAAALLTNGVHTGITATYVDASSRVDLVVIPSDAVLPRLRREMFHVANYNAISISSVGWLAPSTTGLRFALVTDGIGPLLDFQSGATIGNTAKLTSPSVATERGHAPDLGIEIRTDPTSIASVRYWFGLGADQSATTTLDTTTFGAWFTYDSTRDGTVFWRCVSDHVPGASTTTTTSVAVVAATRYRFRILMDATHDYFYINDVLVATHTTTLSVSTDAMAITCTITTLTAAVKSFYFANMYLRMRG